MPKRTNWSPDIPAVVLYGKQTDTDSMSYPVTLGPNGELLVNNGLIVPIHNEQVIDETDPNDVIITYKLNSITVGTKRITVVGSITTITIL